MNNPKYSVQIIIPILVLFLFSGCNLFTEGRKKLNEYCPGLNVELNYVNWTQGDRNIFVLGCNAVEKAQLYFENHNNWYIEGKTADFQDITIKSNDENVPAINEHDHILVKVFLTGKGTTKVVFDETTQHIIIAEYFYVHY